MSCGASATVPLPVQQSSSPQPVSNSAGLKARRSMAIQCGRARKKSRCKGVTKGALDGRMTKLAAALLLVASTASAQNMVATDGMTHERTPRAIEGRLGMLLGGSDVGDADGFSVGISGALAGALLSKIFPRPWSDLVLRLFGAWAITAVLLAGGYFTWSLWPW